MARTESRSQAMGSGSPMGPFSLVLRRMMEGMDRLFDLGGAQNLSSLGRELLGGGEKLGLWSPKVDMFERKGQLVIRADLPGLSKDDVRVELTDDAVILSGEKRSEAEETKGDVYRFERSYGSFRRVIPLPEGVEVEGAEATFENGVLEIALKAPQENQRGRRIEIQSKGTEKQTNVH